MVSLILGVSKIGCKPFLAIVEAFPVLPVLHYYEVTKSVLHYCEGHIVPFIFAVAFYAIGDCFVQKRDDLEET